MIMYGAMINGEQKFYDLFLWWCGLLNDNGASEMLKFYW